MREAMGYSDYIRWIGGLSQYRHARAITTVEGILNVTPEAKKLFPNEVTEINWLGGQHNNSDPACYAEHQDVFVVKGKTSFGLSIQRRFAIERESCTYNNHSSGVRPLI